jgi:hypothetical protein
MAKGNDNQRKDQDDRKKGRRLTIQGLFIMYLISTLMFLFPFPEWSIDLANWMFSKEAQATIAGMVGMTLVLGAVVGWWAARYGD